MTAFAMVDHFKARGPSKGPWRCPCPVHQESKRGRRSATLAIYAGPDRTRVHCFYGCKQDDILAAVGLTWKDCYYEQRVSSPETRKRMFMVQQLEVRERRIGLMEMLLLYEPAREQYWSKAIANTETEIIWLRRTLYPDKLLPLRYRGGCTKWNKERM
jgi:hypothetical protein